MTYVCGTYSAEVNDALKALATKVGIKTPAEQFHTTVVYSEKPLGIKDGTEPLDFGVPVKPTKLVYLGDVGTKWRALALVVESDPLDAIHLQYCTKFGYVPRHEHFLQHVSLGYAPPEGLDLEGFDELFPSNMQITRLTTKPLKHEG
jgi:hypothetical protein